MKLARYGIAVLALSLLCSNSVFASTTGTIDPNNLGYHYAAFVHAPSNQAGSAEINFGKFTTATSDDITISNGALHGFAWSAVAGWIVVNCANTMSGCTNTDQNFKVAVSNTGILSGYAWGQQTGWINFGPFTNNNTPQVQMSSNGNFAGTSGNAGYAWSETYGWIVFDCSNANTCVNTDYNAAAVVSSNNTGTRSGGSSLPQSTTPTQQPTNPSNAVIPPTTNDNTSPTPTNNQGTPSSVGGNLEPTSRPPLSGPQRSPRFVQIPPPETPAALTPSFARHLLSTPVTLLLLVLIFIVLLRFL